jgi:hypothetical protein
MEVLRQGGEESDRVGERVHGCGYSAIASKGHGHCDRIRPFQRLTFEHKFLDTARRWRCLASVRVGIASLGVLCLENGRL